MSGSQRVAAAGEGRFQVQQGVQRAFLLSGHTGSGYLEGNSVIGWGRRRELGHLPARITFRARRGASGSWPRRGSSTSPLSQSVCGFQMGTFGDHPSKEADSESLAAAPNAFGLPKQHPYQVLIEYVPRDLLIRHRKLLGFPEALRTNTSLSSYLKKHLDKALISMHPNTSERLVPL